MDQISTPLALLERVQKTYLHTFRYLDKRGTGSSSVSDDVYLHLIENGMELSAAVASVPVVAACYTWRDAKRMYVFDDTLARSLVEQAEDPRARGPVSFGIYTELPLNAFYVQAPGVLSSGIDGFFLWLENTDTLRFVFLLDDMCSCFSAFIQPTSGNSVKDYLPDPGSWIFPHILNAARGDPTAMAIVMGRFACPGPSSHMIHNLILRALQLVQYLSCGNAELTVQEKPAAAVSQPELSGETFRVGVEVGAKLREAEHRTPGVSPKAHTRKGHWHTYWVGPRSGDRRKITKWVSPTLVGKVMTGVDVKIVDP